MKTLTKSECCFFVISVARKVTNAPVNRSSTQQSLGRATGSMFQRQQSHYGDKSTRCVGQEIALLSRARGGSNQQVSHFSERADCALLRLRGLSRCSECAGCRTAQSARILNLQIEMEWLEFLAEFTKRARCEITRRTTPPDDV